MKQDLKKLIEISRFYGKDKRAVIAGGGNTSMKTSDQLWIKSSGLALEGIDEEGFAILDREKLEKISKRSNSEQESIGVVLKNNWTSPKFQAILFEASMNLLGMIAAEGLLKSD